MDTLYFYCAIVGGTLLVVQTLLLAFAGSGGHADIEVGDPHDLGSADMHGGDVFVKVLSFKTLVAFVTFFGLAGLASREAGIGTTPALAIALGAGVMAIFVVAHLMQALSRLHSRGNVDLANAVGHSARVYLRVPPQRSGAGRVTVALQGRTVEARAITTGHELATGTEVRIVGVHGDGTLEVAALD